MKHALLTFSLVIVVIIVVRSLRSKKSFNAISKFNVSKLAIYNCLVNIVILKSFTQKLWKNHTSSGRKTTVSKVK